MRVRAMVLAFAALFAVSGVARAQQQSRVGPGSCSAGSTTYEREREVERFAIYESDCRFVDARAGGHRNRWQLCRQHSFNDRRHTWGSRSGCQEVGLQGLAAQDEGYRWSH